VPDEIETAFLAGAVAALRKRAAQQRGIAKAHGDGSGEAAIALRLASELDRLAVEFELEAS
jgi:hypothetical protein